MSPSQAPISNTPTITPATIMPTRLLPARCVSSAAILHQLLLGIFQLFAFFAKRFCSLIGRTN
ncbi:hypothetical protein [Methylomicrobium lacus]|uniref:hypothetical protein n=1 Tax=Methylomicrobium lacus TaxID=136992 RepID=UPI0013770304